ncbi:MAG: peptide chain release factor N(5)-glutamine methyltransferase [Brevundimonas sp.]|uniref:Release factor glutamine methyltransferase n=1 Tax=Brevundimonas albigilva TaxID=1312364 RepID=A0ABY4SMZ6_9CAUL|nr:MULTISPECIES: peptide chain release factor N(5)-glutamine methyltransferase [Brevundimonas]PZU55966.1 MAG: peptide chain release factor N(5)-glutamine methyltransferase [Brevundimonas sp.]UQV17076.1 peptide chain release factor N(5)-glutamine methyltransferase [Brevundimonas albigilva]URI15289.1 peptide chain release factor N(5)-glutamine methyltransferase [Brevundimonas albigilva]
MTDPLTPKPADATPTLLTVWKAAQARLKEGRIDSPAIDARLLLEAAAGASRTDILTDPYRAVADDQRQAYEAMVERRLRREPVSRILGKKGFWKIMLNVTPDVLSPRPDTETLLDVALLAFAPHEAFSVIDLGTGSGAILLALLSERTAATGVGSDISSEALAVARENAANLDLNGRATFLRTEWAAGFGDHSFDLVVSNPPYIPTDHIAGLDPEVRDHDPHLALDGGPDGLQAYRDLAPEVMRILKPGGVFAVEIGWDQGPQVKALFEAAGFADVKVVKDLADRDRVVTNGPDPRVNPIPQAEG